MEVVGLLLDTSGIGHKQCRRLISRIKIGYIEIAKLICFQRKFVSISLKRAISNKCRHVTVPIITQSRGRGFDTRFQYARWKWYQIKATQV